MKKVLSAVLSLFMAVNIVLIPNGGVIFKSSAAAAEPAIKVSVSGNNPVISWKKTKKAVSYHVYRINTKTGKYEKIAETENLLYVDTNVESKTAQKYYVRAIDKNGDKIAKSAARTTLRQVKNLKAAEIKTDSVTLTWDKAVNAEKYVVEQSINGKWTTVKTTSKLSLTVKDLKRKTSYKFRVRSKSTVNKTNFYGLRSSVLTVKTNSELSTDELAALAAEVLRLTNKERKNNGLSALSGNNATLNSAAMVRAPEIIERFSHTRPDDKRCFTAYTDLGGKYSGMGENIAGGQATPDEVVEDWMDSEGHRKNILNPNYTHLGVGVAEKNGRFYWVQLFLY
ncbi:MAG: CAP domain-containing protein [Oscillospiraceae bacterium]|jgi:uncharacterized protein YkwD|nr:CAP domain-containing protein [Oscillospiraceae bacterium]